MTLKEAQGYLNSLVAQGLFEKGSFIGFDIIETIIFAEYVFKKAQKKRVTYLQLN